MGQHKDNPRAQLFKTQMGQAATIQRENVKGELMAKANLKLAHIGEEINPIANNLKYMGSAAVHIYWNDTLKQVFFITQAQPLVAHKCPEHLAQTATKDLIGGIMEAYGHKRPKLRSGF